MGEDAGPDERRGVTSVVGIILMIGVLFLIAMGAAAGAFLIASTLPDAPKQAGFSFDFTDDGTSDRLDIRHISGDTLNGSNVTIQLSDAFSEENEGRYVWTDDLGGPSPASPGTAVNLSVATVDDEDTLNLNGATVKVIWTGASKNGSSNTLMTWTGPGTVSPNSDSVSKVGGSADTEQPPGSPGDAVLTFEFTSIENVTIVAFEVESRKGLGVDRVKRGQPELKITGPGTSQDGKADSSSGYETNGIREYPLNQTAKIRAKEGKAADVNIGDLRQNGAAVTIDSVEFTSEENANFVVTFVFADGSEKQFYFEITLA